MKSARLYIAAWLLWVEQFAPRRAIASPVYVFAVTLVSAIHLTWAGIILTYGSIPQSTTLAPVALLFPFPWGAWLLLSAAALAISSFWVRRLLVSAALVIPQQFILIISAFGAINAIVLSQFADGVIRPRQFIAVDQVYSLVLAVFYVYACATRTAK